MYENQEVQFELHLLAFSIVKEDAQQKYFDIEEFKKLEEK